MDNGSLDDSYLEYGLPDFLNKSIHAFIDGCNKVAAGEEYYKLDCDFCLLQSDINSAEIEQIISPRQAWYLRKKYLGIAPEDVHGNSY